MTRKASNEDLMRLGIPEDRSLEPISVWKTTKGGKVVFTGTRVSSISVPDGTTAHGRVVRAHELLHARFEPTRPVGKYPDDVENAVSDAYMQAHHWPRASLRFLDEDLYQVFSEDLVAIIKHWPSVQEPHQWFEYNLTVHVALRLAAIQRYFMKSRYKSMDQLPGFAQPVWDAYQRVKMDMDLPPEVRGRFMDRLTRIWPTLVSLAGEVDLKGPQERKQWRKYRVRITEQYMELLKNPPPSSEAGKTRRGKGNPWEESDTHGGAEGPAGKKIMEVVRLPLTTPTDPDSARAVPARSGQRLNMGRLSSCIAQAKMAGMFRRRRLTPLGGSVLIDFSGSMNFSPEEAHEICRISPGGTLAYYEGRGYPLPFWGRLTIYAQGGMRSDEVPSRRWGDNSVDYWAILWLLQQPVPRILISDEGFCGGPEVRGVRQYHAARNLLNEAVRCGEVEVLPTVAYALEKFRERRR